MSQGSCDRADRLYGCLMGTALGDSLGLPMEGLAPRRANRLFPEPLRQRLLPGQGVTSDDTAQTIFVLQSLWDADGDVAVFEAALARRLRRWFLWLPPGIGLSTAKACVRLALGFGPRRSGVPSAGNGAAMRSAVIGCFYVGDEALRVAFTEASARITHTDPRAIEGAQLVALAAACSATGQHEGFEERARPLAPEWERIVGHDAPERGVSGFVLHTVPAALACWLRHPTDLRGAIEDAVALGGDTDTVAAIVGGIVGAAPEHGGVPDEWLRWVGWPRHAWLRELSRGPVAGPSWPAMAAQHALTLPVVLAHGFRRMAPPY